MLGLVKVGDH